MNGYEYLLETARQELDAAQQYQDDRNPEHDNALRRAVAYAAVAQAAALCRIADVLAAHSPATGEGDA